MRSILFHQGVFSWVTAVLLWIVLIAYSDDGPTESDPADDEFPVWKP